MTSKHTPTPGPWIAVGPWVEHPRDTIADICTCNPANFGQSQLTRSDEEQCANARLIAAAPDMLEALRQLYEATPDNEGGALGKACVAARAAIAKAEGQ